jgi:hypothetical protein
MYYNNNADNLINFFAIAPEVESSYPLNEFVAKIPARKISSMMLESYVGFCCINTNA